jgi:phosphoribosyl-ATP pyrophosphohydrolase/phosphoribosyl-AMP cyclohydrolase
MNLRAAIVRDSKTRTVLMLAWMNDESLQKTYETGETWFWSRSRNELWHKGATSGNRQKVVSIREDCDRDALLIDVEPLGPACHRGTESCFEDEGATGILEWLYARIASRRQADPATSYTARLFSAGRGQILEKINEESGEVIVAAETEPRARVIAESADLLYHLLVLLAAENITPQEVAAELRRRAK